MKTTNTIGNFFGEVISEVKKITWPTREEAIRYTITVIILTLIVAIILGLFDYGFQYLLEKFVLKR
jgi:preprotein translocase subunit SecE